MPRSLKLKILTLCHFILILNLTYLISVHRSNKSYIPIPNVLISSNRSFLINLINFPQLFLLFAQILTITQNTSKNLQKFKSQNCINCILSHIRPKYYLVNIQPFCIILAQLCKKNT